MTVSDILSSIPMSELLPQREPFVMVSRLVQFDPVVATTQLDITSDNLFVEEGTLIAAGVIENIAQTCAARIGYINRQSSEGVRLGFIGAIRNLNILRLPKVGETLSTTITVVEEVFGMTLVNAVVKVADEVIAQTEMKIALSDIVAQG